MAGHGAGRRLSAVFQRRAELIGGVAPHPPTPRRGWLWCVPERELGHELVDGLAADLPAELAVTKAGGPGAVALGAPVRQRDVLAIGEGTPALVPGRHDELPAVGILRHPAAQVLERGELVAGHRAVIPEDGVAV